MLYHDLYARYENDCIIEAITCAMEERFPMEGIEYLALPGKGPLRCPSMLQYDFTT